MGANLKGGFFVIYGDNVSFHRPHYTGSGLGVNSYLGKFSLTVREDSCIIFLMRETIDKDKRLAELRAKLRVATINAEKAEARAVEAIRVVRNIKEAREGLERAMNIW